MKYILITIFTMMGFIGGYMYRDYKEGILDLSQVSVVKEKIKNTLVKNPSDGSHCALILINPKPFSTVSNPLSIDVVVDVSDTCRWTVFEAQAGTVSLIDEKGTEIATTTLKTQDNWMTTDPVDYSAILDVKGYTGNAKLVFTEEVAQDGVIPQKATYPIKIQ